MDYTIHTILYQTDSATWAEGQCESHRATLDDKILPPALTDF